jgi:hypothetical protein
MIVGDEFGVILEENYLEIVFGGFCSVVKFKCPCLKNMDCYFDFESLFIQKCYQRKIQIPILKMESGLLLGYSNNFILEPKLNCRIKLLEYRINKRKKIKERIM